MSVNAIYESVRKYLASLYMYVENEWLTGCITYLTEDKSKSYSIQEIQTLTKEQWLLNNLNDICPGSLPANLREHKKVLLSDCYVVQVNSVIDIGTPAYQQYLTLQKVNQENIDATTNPEEKINNHRVLKLYLTDGVQELSAIEFKPMRNISTKITPGSKALLKGPVECRRGVVLLTESNFQLLGGEVEELSELNSQPSLLSSRLRLPLTVSAPNTVTNMNINIVTGAEANSTKEVERILYQHTETPSIQLYPYNEVEVSKPVARVTSLQALNSFSDEDLDIEMVAAFEAELLESLEVEGPVPPKPDLNKRSYTSNGESQLNPEKKIKTVNQIDGCQTDEDLFTEDDNFLRDFESDTDKQDKTNVEEVMFPIKIAAEPFTYIKVINELPESEKTGRVFKVKGQIIKLLSKLSVGREGWSLRCAIVDGTGSLDVDFTSDVLSKLVGYTPSEINQLKREIGTRPELKEMAVHALQKAKHALQVLYCIIELTFTQNSPKITKLIPFGESNLRSLEKRSAHIPQYSDSYMQNVQM